MARLLIAYVLNLLDLVVTTYWMDCPFEIEGNPVGRWLYDTHLVVPVKTIGVGVILIVLYVAIKRKPELAWVSRLVLTAYVVLTAYHIVLSIFYFLITYQIISFQI